MICVVNTKPVLIFMSESLHIFGIVLDKEKPQNKNK